MHLRTEMPLAQLPHCTRKLISSTQIITSVENVVKELVENALDARATNIEVKLENNGLNRIEVHDNGCGIIKTDIELMCLPHYTSKIKEFCDLNRLSTYGFRGEALNSLCNVADVTVTTRTAEDELAMTYSFNKDGKVVSSKPSHFGKGTYVVVSNLFRNLPVRRQFISSRQQSSAELKRVESIVKNLAVIHPGLRVIFCHNKCMIWQKPIASSLHQSVLLALGHGIATRLEMFHDNQCQTSITLFVPKRHCKDIAILFQSSAECMMIFFNLRPVRHKKLEKLLVKLVSQHFGKKVVGRKYPVCLVSVEVSPELLDVNLEPNKNQVLCKDEAEILERVEKKLSTYYELEEENHSQHSTVPKRPRLGEISTEETVSSGVTGGISVAESLQCHAQTGFNGGFNGSLGVASKTADSVKKLETSSKDSNSTLNGAVKPRVLPREVDLVSARSVLENISTNTGTVSKTLSNGATLETVRETLLNIDRTSSLDTEKNKESTNIHTKTFLEHTGTIETQHQACSNKNQEHLFQFVGQDNDECDIKIDLDEEFVDLCDGVLDFEYVNVMDDTNRGLPTNKDNIHLGSTVVDTQGKAGIHDKTKDDNFADGKILRTGEEIGNNGVASGTDNCVKDLVLDTSENVNSTMDVIVSNKVLGSRDKVCSNGRRAPAATQGLCDAVDISVGQWSKGYIKASNGDLIQGSKLLLPRANDLDLSSASVTSQMGCKENSAFTKFSREIRPKIFLECPGLPFTKVASMLVSRWQALSTDEQCRYEKLAKEESKKPWKKSPRNHNVKDMFTSRIASKSEKCARSSVELCISLEELRKRRYRTRNNKRCESAQDMMLVGQLKSPGVWLYQQNCRLGVVRHWALHEMVLYREFMAQHSVPVVLLDTALPVHKGTLGADLWDLLQSLTTQVDPVTNTVNICSAVIAKNGFVIQLTEGGMLLTHVASTIRFYGLDDLREVLQLWQGCKEDSDLTRFRPLKVLNYFKSEAVRIARLIPYSMDGFQLLNLIHKHNVHDKNCLHGKLVFQTIHTFNE